MLKRVKMIRDLHVISFVGLKTSGKSTSPTKSPSTYHDNNKDSHRKSEELEKLSRQIEKYKEIVKQQEELIQVRFCISNSCLLMNYFKMIPRAFENTLENWKNINTLLFVPFPKYFHLVCMVSSRLSTLFCVRDLC